MSHFNRWWSKQRIEDKEAKRFSHTVWNEAAKPYQATIDKLTAELAEVREEYGHKCAKCGSVLQLVRPGKWQCQKCELDNMLYEAHRKGWEQAKAEAKHLSFSCSCHKAIAAMTYKEEER